MSFSNTAYPAPSRPTSLAVYNLLPSEMLAQGSHTAMKSGMLAAEALYPHLTQHGEAGTVAAAGEELLETPEAGMGHECKSYDDGETVLCAAVMCLSTSTTMLRCS
jgi:hypothetical protein